MQSSMTVKKIKRTERKKIRVSKLNVSEIGRLKNLLYHKVAGQPKLIHGLAEKYVVASKRREIFCLTLSLEEI